MNKKSKRYSCHLYDIYKLYPVITFDDNFKKLVCQVCEHRSNLPICPSAMSDIDVKAFIYEFLDDGFYRQDYETITRALISDHVITNRLPDGSAKSPICFFDGCPGY